MTQLTQADLERFLAAPRHAVVATNSHDGPPQLSPVWYVHEGGRLYISTGPTTAKVRNLQRDPRITVCVDGGFGDSRYVVLSGEAEIVPNGTPQQQEMRWRIIRQYHDSEESARTYFNANKEEGQVLIVVTPAKIISQDFN